MKFKTFSFVALAAIGSFGLIACSGKGGASGGSIATVNGTPITQEEYLRYIMLKPRIAVLGDSGPTLLPVAQPIGIQALQEIVQRKIVKQLAMDEKAWPSDKEIESELAFREQTNPQLVRQLVAKGLSPALIKEEIGMEMAQERMVTKGVTVTPDEVAKFIKDNPKNFEVPASADLVVVFVRTDKEKATVDEELKLGQMFEAVAMRYSQLPNARQNRGRYPNRVIEQMPKQIKEIVTKNEPLKPTPWIKVDKGWAKFYMVSKTPAKAMPIDENMRERVRRELAKQRGAKANDLGERLAKKMRESNIDVSMTELKDPWNRMFAQIKNQGAPPSIENMKGGDTPPTAEAPPGGGG